jgi:hypothetical protein
MSQTRCGGRMLRIRETGYLIDGEWKKWGKGRRGAAVSVRRWTNTYRVKDNGARRTGAVRER